MKKLITCTAIILSFVFAFPFSGSAWNDTHQYFVALYLSGYMARESNGIFGDCTQNGKVDAGDALLTLRLAVQPETMYQRLVDDDNRMYWFEQYGVQFFKRDHHISLERDSWGDEHNFYHGEFRNGLYQYFVRNMYFLADVSNDNQLDATDALLILQYAVGKIEEFPRTDYVGADDFVYMDWLGDWYPTKYFDLRTIKTGENAYDSVADIFPDIPPVQTE